VGGMVRATDRVDLEREHREGEQQLQKLGRNNTGTSTAAAAAAPVAAHNIASSYGRDQSDEQGGIPLLSNHHRQPSFTADGFMDARKLLAEATDRQKVHCVPSSSDEHREFNDEDASAVSPAGASAAATATFTMPASRPEQKAIPQPPPPPSPSASTTTYQQLGTVGTFSNSLTGRTLTYISQTFIPNSAKSTHSGSALAGFLSLLLVTCSSYMLSPMRDAAALAVGVSHIPSLTLASTVLALASSVPVGWLFEAPNPARRGRFYNRVGITRGETQGTSLALFYRCFAFCLVGYAVGFKIVEMLGGTDEDGGADGDAAAADIDDGVCPAGEEYGAEEGQCVAAAGAAALSISTVISLLRSILTQIVKSRFGKLFYVAFFLVVHLMKLHSLSLIWGVTSEAMEYEEQAEKRERQRLEEEEARAAVAQAHHRHHHHSHRRYSAPHGSHPAHKHKPVLTSIPSGEVAPTNVQHQEAEQERRRQAAQQQQKQQPAGSRSRIRLKRLAFVGFGGTLGGILGSIIASGLARTLHISGLLVVAAILLEFSAELSIELGKIMLRHWQEEQIRIQSCCDLTSLAGMSGGMSSSTSLASLSENQELGDDVDSSMKRVASLGSMKRIASGNSLSSMQRARSTASLASVGEAPVGMKRSAKSMGSLADAAKRGAEKAAVKRDGSGSVASSETDQVDVEDSSFKQRLLRGIRTILRSRLLMCIFTYNALAATTSVLLSFQRAELVANRTVEVASTERDTAFLANVNMASSVAVFALQASGLGAFIASSCGQYGTLILMPMIRMFGVSMLAWWHVQGSGQAPNLTLFLLLDEFTKVINFAVAKPVRESLWRGLSAEARYDAKPIVDTLANRWGGGSAAFVTSAITRIMETTGAGSVTEDGTKTLFGFPPVLILCSIAAVWWAVVSVDLGAIRKRIDAELKKQV